MSRDGAALHLGLSSLCKYQALLFFALLDCVQHGFDKGRSGLRHTLFAVYAVQDLHTASGRASEAWWQRRERERVRVCCERDVLGSFWPPRAGHLQQQC